MDSELIGWTEYFNELASFLASLERQYGIANDAYAEYAVHRISLCLSSLSLIKSVFSEALEGETTMPKYRNDAYTNYCKLTDQIAKLSCIISKQWELAKRS